MLSESASLWMVGQPSVPCSEHGHGSSKNVFSCSIDISFFSSDFLFSRRKTISDVPQLLTPLLLKGNPRSSEREGNSLRTWRYCFHRRRIQEQGKARTDYLQKLSRCEPQLWIPINLSRLKQHVGWQSYSHFPFIFFPYGPTVNQSPQI